MKPRLIKDWPVIMNQEGQCQVGSVSLSSHKSISGKSPSVSIWLEKRDQSKPYLALDTEINFRPRREKETSVWSSMASFSPAVSTRAPEGH